MAAGNSPQRTGLATEPPGSSLPEAAGAGMLHSEILAAATITRELEHLTMDERKRVLAIVAFLCGAVPQREGTPFSGLCGGTVQAKVRFLATGRAELEVIVHRVFERLPQLRFGLTLERDD